jgi:hypothetical protein
MTLSRCDSSERKFNKHRKSLFPKVSISPFKIVEAKCRWENVSKASLFGLGLARRIYEENIYDISFIFNAATTFMTVPTYVAMRDSNENWKIQKDKNS